MTAETTGQTSIETAQVETIYKNLREPIRSFIAKRVTDSPQVEDLVHDVFLKIHTKINTLKEPDKLTSWVYQIARNSILDYYKTKREIVSEINEEIMPARAIEPPDISDRLTGVVRRMIEQLPDAYKIPLKMADLEHRKHKEIAEELGLSVPGVKSRVQRGRRMLKELLLECCHFEFDKYGTVFDYSQRNCIRCCENPSSCHDPC